MGRHGLETVGHRHNKATDTETDHYYFRFAAAAERMHSATTLAIAR